MQSSARTLRTTTAIVLALAVTACVQVGSRPDAVVSGTVEYPPVFTLADKVNLRVTLLDASAEGGSEPVAEVEIGAAERPASFALHYDARAVDDTHRYVLEAQLTGGGRVLLMTTEEYPVITLGNEARANLVLRAPGEPVPAATQ